MNGDFDPLMHPFYTLFCTAWCDEGIEEAKEYCRKSGLTPKDVRIKSIIFEKMKFVVVETI